MAYTKYVFTSGSFTCAGVTYPIINMKFDQTIGSQDLTDTSTAGNGKDIYYGRIESKFSADMWADASGSNPSLGVKGAISMDMGGGRKYVGSGSLESISEVAAIDNGVKFSITGQFSGAVTQSHA